MCPIHEKHTGGPGRVLGPPVFALDDSARLQPALRVADQVCDLVGVVHRGTGVVDNMVDATVPIEKNGEDIVQLYPRCDRHFEAACGKETLN